MLPLCATNGVSIARFLLIACHQLIHVYVLSLLLRYRYTLVTGASPGQDVPLSNESVQASRNFANKLWNAGRYLVGNLQGTSTLTSLFPAAYFRT
jgi:hypothetical protein